MAASSPTSTDKGFGTCCETLRDAMGSDEFEPLISVADDGILYATIGLVDVDEEAPGLVEYPMLFCPFCGTRLQSDDVIKDTDTD
jgi:hypothetical protein